MDLQPSVLDWTDGELDLDTWILILFLFVFVHFIFKTVMMTATPNTSTNLPLAKPKILCVDDEIDNLDALERIFRKTYQVFKAISAKEATLTLKNHLDIGVIISDQRMPIISGVEFLEGTVNTHPESTRILLTGYTDIDSVITAINKGQIFRYITKPWDTADLMNTVDRAYEKYQLRQDLRKKNEDLQSALQELQTLDKTKSQFMILINHELKTPLTAILSFAGLLKETVLTEEQRLFVDRINKSSEKLKSIIDDVLLIVKGEMGLIKVIKEKSSSEFFFKNWPADFNASMKSKNQTLALALTATHFNSDPQLLKTVIQRALHNATKFGLANSTITLAIFDNTDGRTQIDIFNEGPNINESLIEKIYKPFTLDENVMNHSVGMGLGLTICQTLIRSMNGNMVIKNEDRGVKISFIL